MTNSKNMKKTNNQIIQEREENLSEINKILELLGISSESELDIDSLSEIYTKDNDDLDEKNELLDDDGLENLDNIF